MAVFKIENIFTIPDEELIRKGHNPKEAEEVLEYFYGTGGFDAYAEDTSNFELIS